MFTALKAKIKKIIGIKPVPHQTVTPAQQEGLEVHVLSYSQPHVLNHCMQQAGMTHDQQVVADLKGVRIRRGREVLDHLGVESTIFFCPLQWVNIKEIINEGDKGELPDEVAINGLKFPEDLPSGVYTLKNVVLHSNGKMSVTPTLTTEWQLEYI